MADVSEKKTVEKHRAYDVKFKLKVIEAATKTSISAASREFSIDRKRIREWIKHREKLQQFTKSGKTKRKRLTGGGRKANDEDMEDSLFGWIVDLRSRNLRISRDMIVRQAKTLSTDPSFKVLSDEF